MAFRISSLGYGVGGRGGVGVGGGREIGFLDLALNFIGLAYQFTQSALLLSLYILHVKIVYVQLFSTLKDVLINLVIAYYSKCCY